jgi:hypothetical protein
MKTEEPQDPQYNGEVVINDKENVEEKKTGLFGLFKNTSEDDVNSHVIEELPVELKKNEEEKTEGEEEKPEGEEEQTEKKGLLSSLFGKKEEPDCELLLRQMRDCVNEKDGTTMCKLEVGEWEKHCKKNKDEEKDEDKDEDKDENKDENKDE